MNIIIIEDEVKTARLLEGMIATVRPGVSVVARLQSIEASVQYLSANPAPDLIFMDIQLSDGLCFEIFGGVKVDCPVVFCTAFDHYSLEAFKANGIAYIVKPFTKEDVALVFKKIDELSRFFAPDVSGLLARIVPPAGGKKSFLVFKEQKYLTVATDRIAFFYIRHGSTTIRTFEQQDYALQQSLDQVAGLVSATQFFRLNRQYLINFSAIREVEHYFMRKLIVHLVVPAPDTLLINKERSQSFLQWMEDR
ncbi:MAG TPA: LytTR family DNA-binding domain-containing protein [Puia sp.]|nr:LytTR family DNA-binding domain-containing protein [Puia sp.]